MQKTIDQNMPKVTEINNLYMPMKLTILLSETLPIRNEMLDEYDGKLNGNKLLINDVNESNINAGNVDQEDKIFRSSVYGYHFDSAYH